jgi:hypothetical protein
MTAATLPERWNPTPEADDWIHGIASKLGVSPPAPDDPIFARLFEALMMRDELGDDLAGWYKSDKANKSLFEAFLRGRFPVDAPVPPALARLDRELLSNRPDWADPATMRSGANAHLRLGMLGRLASGTLGLLDGYRSAPIAKTLTMTGSLDTATARRLDETSRFFTQIIFSDGMAPDSEGFRAAIKVRLVHAFVRHGLVRSNRWQADVWGMPITVMDSLGTAMSFWVPTLLAAPTFGYSLTRREAEGMMTLWNYVGHLQGVPDVLLPTTLEETYRVYLAILMQIGRPSEDSVKLARAYIDAASQRQGQSSWFNEKMVVGAAVRLLPPSHRRELGIANTLFRFWPDLLRSRVRKADAACHADPGAYAATVADNRRLFAAELVDADAPDEGYDPAEVIHDHSQLERA